MKKHFYSIFALFLVGAMFSCQSPKSNSAKEETAGPHQPVLTVWLPIHLSRICTQPILRHMYGRMDVCMYMLLMISILRVVAI